MGGSEQMGGREKGAPARNSSSGGGAAMAGGKDSPERAVMGPTGHGSKNRGHREMVGVRANSPRPRMGPEDAAGAGVAMAAGESSRPHAKRALEAMKQEINCTGR